MSLDIKTLRALVDALDAPRSTKQCEKEGRSCIYVAGHSGDCEPDMGGPDRSDEIRLKLVRDRRDELQTIVRQVPALLARVEELERERDVYKALATNAEHWADCATNHGGAECDMGPECGLRPEARAELLTLTTDRDRLAGECERLRALVSRAADSLDCCGQRHGEHSKSVRGDELRAAAKEGLT